jgi:hypothetical protein
VNYKRITITCGPNKLAVYENRTNQELHFFIGDYVMHAPEGCMNAEILEGYTSFGMTEVEDEDIPGEVSSEA